MAHNEMEMTQRSPVLDREKYLNALVYFVANCGNERLGIMKLNKLFYYLDFISYRDRNKSVTGETYIHLPKGPFAAILQDDILGSARKAKLIEQKKDASDKYGERNRFQALKAPDMSVFDDYEQKLLNYLCFTFKDWSTDQMVAQTHSEAPWVFSKPSQQLNYKDADDIEFFSPRREVVA
ncbi:hypothetical protein A3D68_00980 [Candidatus Adlerbacteria bacterium RIFCSPHIGHO2_02_FULL_52_17]|uniref:Antitoxin SocA-like Panacea domain-containing protein n=1 Tax=Candidatus Adlerbacteria bacterium RIFCSPHIGHO2_02_FULL_52_17 TaxID=1797240 RepID=A0A1F4XP43_9BACT|nr:MAG: hypothetical protein A3D68_00980 [Candidatus Adlerbacteria bacterium RIFCSPHIGHO2_02_FULL_52_17]